MIIQIMIIKIFDKSEMQRFKTAVITEMKKKRKKKSKNHLSKTIT